jgi:hypothetical protein
VKYHYSEKKEILLVVGRVQITEKFKPDPEIVSHVKQYSGDLAKKLDVVCGYLSVDLECRFDHMRS